jgi:hypothetical protein
MKGVKAFKKGMVCRDHKFEENKSFEHNGKVIPCESGFHYCNDENALSVLNYYSPLDEFAEVVGDGIIIEHDDKVVTNKLQIKGKISLSKVFEIQFNILKEKIVALCTSSIDANTAGNYSHANTAGNYSHANTAGYKSHANTAGYKSHANTAGNYSHANTAGYKSHANTAGYKSHANTAGNYSHANTAGNYSHANTAGYKSHANTAGNYSHANTAGNYSHANTAGDESHANTAGYKSHANTAGYKSHANTAGNYSHANTAGDESHANTAGDESIACSLGINGRAKSEKGFIIIVDWQYSDKWFIKKIHTAKVGQKIKGVKIESDKWYWFEDGQLRFE